MLYNNLFIMRIDKTLLFSSLANIRNYLINNITNTTSDSCYNIYTDKIAINLSSRDNYHSIRLWKTKVLFNCWYNVFECKQFVGALDYKIDDDCIKIEYLNLNDGEGSLSYDFILNKNDSNLLKKSFLEYTKNLAIKENKKKVIIDVHGNLRIFDKYYKNEGFVATTRRCKDNRFWIEAELNI